MIKIKVNVQNCFFASHASTCVIGSMLHVVYWYKRSSVKIWWVGGGGGKV